MPANVQLQGATLPSIKIYDLGITVAFGQIIQITNQEYASSQDAQILVQRLLLTKLTGNPQAPTQVNLSDVDPQTFNVRPGKLELEDMSPALQELITAGGAWEFLEDPGFTHNPSTDVISWGTGVILFNSQTYTLAPGTLHATANSLLIATLAAGVATLTLEATTFTPAVNQIVIGSYDFTNHKLLLVRGGSTEASEVSYDTTGRVILTQPTVQSVLDALDAYITGFTRIPGPVFLQTLNSAINLSTQGTTGPQPISLTASGNLAFTAGFAGPAVMNFIVNGAFNATATLGMNLTAGSGQTMTLKGSKFVYQDLANVDNLLTITEVAGGPNETHVDFGDAGNLFNKTILIANNGFFVDLSAAVGSTIIGFKSPGGIVRSIGTGIQLINTAQNQSIFVLSADNLNTPTQGNLQSTLPFLMNSAGFLVGDNGTSTVLLNMFLNTSPSPNETTLDFGNNGGNFYRTVLKANNGFNIDLSAAAGSTVIKMISPGGQFRLVGTPFGIFDTTEATGVLFLAADNLASPTLAEIVAPALPLLIQSAGLRLAPTSSQPVKIDGAALQIRTADDASIGLSISLDSYTSPTTAQLGTGGGVDLEISSGTTIIKLPTVPLANADIVAGAIAVTGAKVVKTVQYQYTAGAPTVGDDDTQGYAVFSQWIDTTGPDHYICLSNSTGAAVWKKTTP